VLLFGVNYLDTGGRVVQHDCIGLRVELVDHRAAGLSLSRQAVSALLRAPVVRTALESVVRARRAAVHTEASRTAEAVEQRVDRIRLALESLSQPIFQESLFDRRAEQQARARAEQTSRLLSHLARTSDAARALRQVLATNPHLVAAWVTG
jgi:hypothetical protein